MTSSTLAPKKTRPSPAEALRSFYKDDLRAGFLVFLIALPLCLGIAKASGAPPVAGLITAIIGGLVASHIGSAALTIKGPAAGLIAIVLGAVTELTPAGGDTVIGYRRMLAVGVIAALIQLVFALTKAGKLSDFFPSSVIHGMLAAIGVIIISKQLYPLLGVATTIKEPIPLLANLPNALMHLNPYVATIGGVGLALMIVFPFLKNTPLAKIPAQIVVVGLGIALSVKFGMSTEHDYSFAGSTYHLAPSMLVRLPANIVSAIAFPDFSQIGSMVTWKYVAMFALIGSIESLASAKAVDALDPGNNRSDLDKDMLALAVGNLIASSIGGLPMISEIVRSSANIANGAKSSWSNFFHGLFLLLAIVLIPMVLVLIPLASLGALLVFTGFRLASPAGFKHAYEIGKEQLFIFVATLVITLATDLLVGVVAGIALKLVVHVLRGVSPSKLFRLDADTVVEGETTTVRVRGAAVFSNFLGLRGRLMAATTPKVVVDLSATTFVDHTTLERLEEMHEDLGTYHRELAIVGLDQHESASGHKLGAHRRRSEAAVAA